MRYQILCSAVLLAVALVDAPSNAHGRPRTGVKNLIEDVACNSCKGVVEEIDADVMTVVEKKDNNVTVTRKFVPVDLLREGKVLRHMSGMYAYRWSDVKKGDTVELQVLKDDGDGLTYCLAVSIRRRPGAKLPEGQNPKEDQGYDANRVYNAIENGEDVSEEELLKVWPVWVNKETGEVIHTGGLRGGEYREQLLANRKRIADEKAKTDLKAPAAETKDKK